MIVNKYRYKKIKGWGVIQKYQKTNWFKKIIFGKKYEWKNFSRCNKPEEELKFFNKEYKQIIMEI